MSTATQQAAVPVPVASIKKAARSLAAVSNSVKEIADDLKRSKLVVRSATPGIAINEPTIVIRILSYALSSNDGENWLVTKDVESGSASPVPSEQQPTTIGFPLKQVLATVVMSSFSEKLSDSLKTVD